jgi:lipopolysaccharide/colanic/teichoic acid biosynthesis glycosyltransferase
MRCSSERICRLTAGWVTPSWSAACEKLLRSTTAQKAASWRVSIRTTYSCRKPRRAARGFTIGRVPDTTRIEDTLVRGYRQLALETPARPRDVVLRALDVVLASLFLLLSLPVSLTIALLVLVTSGRPVLYRGERVGRGAHVFTMYKFRTLKRGAEMRLGPYLGEELVSRTQGEFTRVGRWLKATQLDEIPQFVNVLRGDMSLVGPRPIRPVFFGELAHELPSYWQRLVVRPGLTGFAQVRRGYETSMGEKLAHDLEWIADRSVRLYLLTVVATGWRVLKQSVGGLLRSRA